MTSTAGADVALEPISPLARALYAALRGFAVTVTRLLWRVEVRGRERIPTVGPFVLAPVHRSNADFLLAGVAVPRRMRFMAKDTLWKKGPGWFGRFMERLGGFPVDRERPDRRAIRTAEDAIALGDPVVIFPEGRRKEGPLVEDLYEGASWVACRQRVPIVPVGIGGSDEVLPKGSRMIRLVKVRIVIGEPIYPDVELTGRIPRRVMSEVTEELRKELQSLYDQVR
jgi:1-acyl-sn-glycerol-3-phosphate acyltransferase